MQCAWYFLDLDSMLILERVGNKSIIIVVMFQISCMILENGVNVNSNVSRFICLSKRDVRDVYMNGRVL